MPTENRSSNTDPRDVFIRLNPLGLGEAELRKHSTGFEDPRTHSDYLLFLAGYRETHPAPQPHSEPIAWMVGTAFWWTKEEAERDAAETGLPIVGVGSMTDIAPAQQHQGEPVAWMDPRSPQMHATISNEVKQHNVKFGGAPASAINGYTVPLYTHADPGDLERCEARLHEVASLCATVEQERDTLRAQLAEAHALLREIRRKPGLFSGDFILRLDETLSANAEPSAPERKYCGDTGKIMVGRSGDANDGNAPILEPCEDCDRGAPVDRDERALIELALSEYGKATGKHVLPGGINENQDGFVHGFLVRAALDRKPF